MLGKRKIKRMNNKEFVCYIVMEAREDYKKSMEEKWPEKVPSLGIPYSKYEWKRIKENLDLLSSYAHKKNLKVEIMEEYAKQRYLRYSYIFYESLND